MGHSFIYLAAYTKIDWMLLNFWSVLFCANIHCFSWKSSLNYTSSFFQPCSNFNIKFFVFDWQAGVIDNNGTIDGLKDASHSRVNSEFCFWIWYTQILISFPWDVSNLNLSRLISSPLARIAWKSIISFWYLPMESLIAQSHWTLLLFKRN